MYAWTSKMEWLDVVQFTVAAAPVGGGANIKARGFSTGFTPASIPLAPLFSCILFFIPFASRQADVGDVLKKRLNMIKAEASKTVNFVDSFAETEATMEKEALVGPIVVQ